MALTDIFDADRARHIPKAMLRRLGALAPAAPEVAAAAPAAAAVAAPSLAYRAGRFLGRGAARFGAPLALGAMGFGMADQAQQIENDPESKDAVERTLQVLSGADITGIGGRIGRWLTGRGEPVTPPAVAPAQMAPTVQDLPYATDAVGFGAVAPGGGTAAPAAPALPAIRPWTEPDLRMGATNTTVARVPEFGTGALQVGRGAVRTIDDRAALPGPVVVAPVADPTGIRGYVGALMNQRQAGLTEARKLAAEKLRVEGLGKGATAAHAGAQAVREQFQVLAAQAHLRNNPGDFAGAAAVAAGRVLPTDTFTGLPTMDQNKVDVLSRRSGAIQRVTVQPKPTENDIAADMKNKKMTREQVLAAYRNRGIDTTGLK